MYLELDGAPLTATTRTSIKRFLNPERFGLAEAYWFQEGRLEAPGQLSVGRHVGSEARISCAKRHFGLARTRIDGLAGARTWCGHDVFVTKPATDERVQPSTAARIQRSARTMA